MDGELRGERAYTPNAGRDYSGWLEPGAVFFLQLFRQHMQQHRFTHARDPPSR